MNGVLKRRSGRATLILLVAVGAAVLNFVAQQAGLLLRGANPVLRLRTYYWGDQLSYLGIAVNARLGYLDPVEPFTRTGVSHYPMGYYSLVGLVARVTDIHTITAWNLIGLLVQSAAVIALAFALSILSRRWWLGLMAPLPFLAGTYSFLDSGNWYTSLEHHAVLWGPYGTLFSKNGEAAGLSLAIMAASACVWAWLSPARAPVKWVVTIAAGAAIGLISTFQTYSFLTAIYAFSYVIAAVVIAHSTRWRAWLAATAVLIAVIFLCGPLVSTHLGQLPTLVFGLLPAVPALVVASVKTKGLVAAGGMATALAAAPQILFTVSGALAGDPFLTYRVSSNVDLGAASWSTLRASLPVIVPLAAAFVLALMHRKRFVAGLTAGIAVATAVSALNDVWGANSEPYRYWLDGMLLSAVAALLGFAVLTAKPSPRMAPDPPSKRVRVMTWVGTACAVLAFALSLPDWVVYLNDDRAQGTWAATTSREKAIAAVGKAAVGYPGGLVLTDGCVEPTILKATSGAAVAHYHLGLAWPSNRDAIDALTKTRATGQLDFNQLGAANVTWLVTDSNCSYRWDRTLRDHLTKVARRRYVLTEAELSPGTHPIVPPGQAISGVVTLWKVH